MDAPPPAPVMSQQQNQPVPTTMHPTPLLSPVEHAPPLTTALSGALMQQAPPVNSTLPPPDVAHQPVPTAFPSQHQPVEQVTPVQPVDPAGPPPEPLLVPAQPPFQPSEPLVQHVEPSAQVSEPLISPPISAHPIPEPIPLFSQNNGSEHPSDKMEESSAQDSGQIPVSESVESVEMDVGDDKMEEVGGGVLDEGEEKKESNDDDDMQLDSPSANEEENVAETTEPNQT